MNPYDVLLKPILSEKSNSRRERIRQFAFEVHPNATKNDVKRAVALMFAVQAEQVRTMIIRGKEKRRGTKVVRLPNRKKAMVTLPEGSKINLFGDIE